MVTLSAARIATEVRRGERSARDTVAGSLTLAEAQQERLNICTLIDSERALARAEEIDARVADGEDPGPLAGVPVALKDIVDHEGRVTTCGSGFYAETATSTATVVSRLEEAGAVVVSRTGLHEFAYGFNSENDWTGPVRNPLDPTLSPGGSSGGSAAAVAAGQVPLAVGTDTGGSVRVPAAMCGVFGLKVTHGRIPLTGVFPLSPSLDTVGPIGSSVQDLAVGYHVMAGYDPADPWSAPQPVVRAGSPRPDLQGLRIGLPVAWLDRGPVVDEVAEGFAAAVAAMRELGATFEEIHDDVLTPPGAIAELAGAEAASIHRTWMAEGRPYGEQVRSRFETAAGVDLDTYVAAQVWRSSLRHRTAVAFAQLDLIATPATAAIRKVIGEESISTPQGDVHHRVALSWFSALVNHMGCPAIAGPVPSDLSPPPALQLVAPWWQEHRLLEVGSALEAAGVFAAVSG